MLKYIASASCFIAAAALAAIAHTEGEAHKTLTLAVPFQSNGTPGIGYNKTIDDAINALQANPKYVIYATGHTRTRGPEHTNTTRGLAFAQRVEYDIITNGINASRVVATSMGEEQPLTQLPDEADNVFQRRLDRVEIKIQHEDIQ